MESIKELKRICQEIRRSTDDWYMWNVLRKVSIRVTWLFLHTPINANGVTLLFTVFGFIVCGVFLIGTKTAFFIGAVLMQLWYVLDLVDGEVARYRNECVATGRFFDFMAHYIVHPWFFIAVGLGLYLRHGNFFVFICSMIAGYSVHLIEALLDVSNSVLYRRLKSKLLDPGKEIVFKRMAAGGGVSGKSSLLKKAFSALHYVSKFPVIIYLMLPLSVINLFVGPELFIGWIYFYAFAATLVWAARVTAFIKQEKIDVEYTQVDQLLNLWGRGQA